MTKEDGTIIRIAKTWVIAECTICTGERNYDTIAEAEAYLRKHLIEKHQINEPTLRKND